MSLEGVRAIGIDEIAWQRGHKYWSDLIECTASESSRSCSGLPVAGLLAGKVMRMLSDGSNLLCPASV